MKKITDAFELEKFDGNLDGLVQSIREFSILHTDKSSDDYKWHVFMMPDEAVLNLTQYVQQPLKGRNAWPRKSTTLRLERYSTTGLTYEGAFGRLMMPDYLKVVVDRYGNGKGPNSSVNDVNEKSVSAMLDLMLKKF